MSRFRLYPSPEQEGVLLAHCAHARFVWNLAVEQQNVYSPRKGPVPRYTAQSRQSTEARGEFAWLAAGSRHTAHADVNAARNIRDIAAGPAVTARGGTGVPGPVNREPQLELTSSAGLVG